MAHFYTGLIVVLGLLGFTFPLETSASSDFVVYGVHQQINMGDTDENPPKDIYINIGKRHGIQTGSKLQALRPTPTYDLINKKLFGDLTVPVGIIRVIHADEIASVARIEKFTDPADAAGTGPRAIMIGDIVRPVK